MTKIDLSLGDTQLILKWCRRYGLTTGKTAYVLATAYWETARTMKPVREAYWMGERWRRDELRYYPWYGRGYVQLTWLRNYQRAERALGVDLTTDPDAVMQPSVSADILVRGMILGWFTGFTLGDYVNGLSVDYVGA